MAAKQASTSSASGDSGEARPPQEYTVRVPKEINKKLVVLKFNHNSAMDFTKCGSVSMVRENNLKEYKLSHDLDQLPKFGAGSEYGRDLREEARRKKFGISLKKYNPDDQPWILKTGHGKQAKKYKGVKEGGISENASYYIFTQCADGAFEATPVQEWYNFIPVIRYKYLNSEEAEEEFSRRDKILNHFTIMTKKRLKNNEDEGDDEEEGKKTVAKSKSKSKKDFLLTELDEWAQLTDEDSDDDEKEDHSDSEKPKKKKEKKSRKQKRKIKGKCNSDDEALEDSDSLDEGQEVDYMTDTDSEDENMYAKDAEIKTDKYESKGVDQDVNSEEEEEEEGEEKKEEEQEEEGEGNDKDKKESESDSSGSDSDSDPEKDATPFSSALFMQAGEKKKSGQKSGESSKSSSRSATPTSQITESDGKAKKRKPATESEGTPAKKAKSDSSTPIGSDGVTEEIIRKYLMRKPMTIKDLLQKLHKNTGIQKEKLSETIAPILRRINPDKLTVNQKLHLHIKKA